MIDADEGEPEEHTFNLGDCFVLRRLQLADAESLFRLVDQNRERLRPWMVWTDWVKGPDDVAAFIRESQTLTPLGPNAYECGLYASGAIAGGIGLNRLDWANRSGNLGYWVDSSLEGRGLVTRGARQLVKLAFGPLGLERLEIRCALSNHRSRSVAVNVGFRYEGTLRGAMLVARVRHDAAVYGRLKSDGCTPSEDVRR